MQEKSWWTWVQGDGTRYAAVPELWRRVADRPRWQDARGEFGPLADHTAMIREIDTDPDTGARAYSAASRGQQAADRVDAGDWQILHGRLKAMARLWQPWSHNPEIFSLTRFNPLQHADAAALRATLEMAAVDGELSPRLDGWHLRVVPQTLRGFLLMTCAADVAAQQRFRRCTNCNEWFHVGRSDNRYCTNACRQAHHRTGGEAA
jgi:hypothetical protein